MMNPGSMSRIGDDAHHASMSDHARTFTAFGLVVQRFLVLVNSVIALAFWCFPPRFALSSAFLDISRAYSLESVLSVCEASATMRIVR